MRMKLPWLFVIWILALLPARVTGQDCNIMSKANDIDPDQLCSPVQVVTWEVSYVGVNHAGTPVEIFIDWDDGDTETIPATELDAATSEWGAITSHTYISDDDILVINQIFPMARVTTIPNAGHWLHVEQASLLLKTIRYFL